MRLVQYWLCVYLPGVRALRCFCCLLHLWHWQPAHFGCKPYRLSFCRKKVHRDTHVHLTIDFQGGSRALGSISKTVHGSPNHFEINLIGSRRYASWNFMNPDVVEISEGAVRSFRGRTDMTLGSRHWPHHGLGWIEGYIEIIHQALLGLSGVKPVSYPTLEENLLILETLLHRPEFGKTGYPIPRCPPLSARPSRHPVQSPRSDGKWNLR